MVEELKLAIKIDDDAIEQFLLKQFANAEKMANKVVLTFNNIDLDDKAIEAKFKEMQKMAGKNPIDLSIDKSSIEMLSAISKQLGNIFDIAKGKSIIDSSATAQIDKLQSKLDELTKKYDELSSKKIGGNVSGKDVSLVDNEEFKKLSQDVQNTKDEITALKENVKSLFQDMIGDEQVVDRMDQDFQKMSLTVDNLTDKIRALQEELSNVSTGNKSNISSENDSLQSTIEALKQLSKLPGGDTLSLGKIMNHIAEGAKLANPEVKKLLELLKLIDSEGKIIGTHINEGTLNSGVDLNDKFAIISRNDAIENVDKLIEKEKEAQQQGILLARTLASVDIGKLHYDIQELAQGSSVHQMKNSTLQQFINETRVLCNATDEQILKLYSDAQKLSDLGFKLDLNPSNIRYDENSGFSFIDLELRKINEEAPQTVAIMHTLTQSLMGFMGQRNRLNWDDEENFYTKDNYLYLQNMLKTYERLQQIFSSKLSTPDFNQTFSDSLQLVKTRISDIETHFENLGTPLKDVFQGDKIDQATTSAKELDKTLEQVNIPTDSFDEVLSKLDLAKSELGEIVKITKQSVSDSEGKFHDSYTLKDRRGSTEIYGLSSNTEKGQLLRSNIVGYDAKAEAQESKRLVEENIRLNKAYYDSKKQEETEYQRLRAKYLAEGKAQEEKYYADLKKSRESTLKSYQDQINSFDKQIPKKPIDGQRSDKFEGFVQDYKNAIEEARKYLDTLGDSPVTKEVKDEWERLIGVIKKTKEEMDAVPNAARGSDADARMKEIDKLTKYLDKNTRISKEAREQLQGYLALLKSGDPSVNVKELHTVWTKVAVAEREAGREGKSFFDILKDKTVYGYAAQLAGYYLSFADFMRYGTKVIENIKEVDTALTELRKVSDATEQRLTANFKNSAKTAKELGSTISDVISATADWSRMGYNIDQAEELARISTLYKNVGDGIDIEDANNSLISTLQGFQLDVSEAEGIIDKFNEVANNYAIDSAGIGEALQRSAASFNAANTDLSKSIALITATNEVVQDPESVGTLWKTMSARIRGAETELEQLNEETDEYTETTSKLRDLVKGLTGFDIMEDENTFKDIYEIILGIGEKWDELTDVEQASLGEALAGKRNANALYAVLGNLDTLQSAYETAENSAGSAMREQENYEKSIQYSLDRLSASVQEWSNTLISSDVVKWFVDLANAAVELSTALTPLGTLAIGGGLFSGIKNVGINTLVAC